MGNNLPTYIENVIFIILKKGENLPKQHFHKAKNIFFTYHFAENRQYFVIFSMKNKTIYLIK